MTHHTISYRILHIDDYYPTRWWQRCSTARQGWALKLPFWRKSLWFTPFKNKEPWTHSQRKVM